MESSPKQSYLQISVDNFGPIRQGTVQLRPLTVFIGPNNSGKTYLALLAHALSKRTRSRPAPFVLQDLEVRRRPEAKPPGRHEGIAKLPQLDDKFAELAHEGVQKLHLNRLPLEMQQVFLHYLEACRMAFRDTLQEDLRDYFGCEDVRSLTLGRDPHGEMSVRVSAGPSDEPFLRFTASAERPDLDLQWSLVDLAHNTQLTLPGPGDLLPAMRLFSVRDELWWEWLEANRLAAANVYYLPSGRSGVLQAAQVLASVALQMVRRRFALERIEMPALTGVAGDFLQVLWERLPPVRRTAVVGEPLTPALRVLEGQMFRGEVSFDETRAERPVLMYRSGGLDLPLQQTSSMVGELAPLDLFIKHLVRPGDVLIIDEPEAHLHPENQRKVATVLVRLVRAGVRVICPTHSPVILHQISNHILASGADARLRTEAGFTDDDLLDSEEVGVYLFDLREGPTVVSPVPIEPGFGISEAEFVRVAEAIGDQTYRLSGSS